MKGIKSQTDSVKVLILMKGFIVALLYYTLTLRTPR